MFGFSFMGFPVAGWNLDITVLGTGFFILFGDLLLGIVMLF
jgi:hypothetical protein